MQQPAVIAARAIPLRTAGRWRRLACALGAVRLALWLIGALALGVLAIHLELGTPDWVLAFPLGLLGLNLACAIAVHPAFRAQGALLGFHLALLALVLLAAAGRLTFLKGTLELADGVPFEGALLTSERGPLHLGEIAQVRFASEGFEVDYAPGLKRSKTRNRVRFVRTDGTPGVATIGDDTPLRQDGYRFYTTPNKGFAPELVWVSAAGGGSVRGALHLPSFPARLEHQAIEWTPPGSARALTVRLELGERLVDLERPWTLRLPEAHALRVTEHGHDTVLRPGEAVQLREGTLRYAGLRMWMGYAVAYDWTLPWMLAAALCASCALAWHFVAKWAREPWDRTPREDVR